MDASYSQNKLNSEIRWILAVLNSYSQEKVQLDGNSLGQLAAIVANIGTLIGEAKIIPTNDNSTDDLDNYREICNSADWKYFQFDHFITCHICHMQIGLSKEEVQAHIQSGKHRWNVDLRKTSMTTTISETVIHDSICAVKNIDEHHTKNDGNTDNGTSVSPNDTDRNTKQHKPNSSSIVSVSTNEAAVDTADTQASNSLRMEDEMDFNSDCTLNSTNDDSDDTKQIHCVPSNDVTDKLFQKCLEQNPLLEMGISIVDPVNAAIKRIFQRNIDRLLKQELKASADRKLNVYPDWCAAVNVGVSIKRKSYVYGSFAYCALSNERIINILFDYHKLYGTSKAMSKTSAVALESLATILNASKTWIDVKQIRVFDQRYAIEAKRSCTDTICHFTFDTGVPIAAARLIEHFFELQPMCKKLTVFIKHWQSTINKENPGCLPLSGYLITILVIFFFQFIDLLPSVHSLQNIEGLTKVNYNGFYVQFDRTVKPRIATASFRVYLHGFFTFYGDMLRTAENFFLSPYHGKILCRTEETVINCNLTTEQKAEHASLKMMRGSNWTNKSIYVQDLFVRSNNIGAAIEVDAIESFQRCCAQSSAILRQL